MTISSVSGNRFAILALAISMWPAAAQGWVWHDRPEYTVGWGPVPPFGLGFHWGYPYVIDDALIGPYLPPVEYRRRGPCEDRRLPPANYHRGDIAPYRCRPY
jgi:hypothetical protein